LYCECLMIVLPFCLDIWPYICSHRGRYGCVYMEICSIADVNLYCSCSGSWDASCTRVQSLSRWICCSMHPECCFVYSRVQALPRLWYVWAFAQHCRLVHSFTVQMQCGGYCFHRLTLLIFFSVYL
jgi:hypothetical protein